MNQTEIQVARALLKIGAIGFCPNQPITFKSGIISPIYVDNRKFPFHPEEWTTVIQGFCQMRDSEKIQFDVVAGIEAAGIPHSAALGYALKKPSVFCRKQVKDHGTKKLIEGGDVTGKQVLLIEDLVTTGGSSLAGVQSLRDSGAIVEDCFVIVSYGFSKAAEAFATAKVNLHTLTTFPIILEEAVNTQRITVDEQKIILDWIQDPWKWRAQ